MTAAAMTAVVMTAVMTAAAMMAVMMAVVIHHHDRTVSCSEAGKRSPRAIEQRDAYFAGNLPAFMLQSAR
jgi:hypothetical protein